MTDQPGSDRPDQNQMAALGAILLSSLYTVPVKMTFEKLKSKYHENRAFFK